VSHRSGGAALVGTTDAAAENMVWRGAIRETVVFPKQAVNFFLTAIRAAFSAAAD